MTAPRSLVPLLRAGVAAALFATAAVLPDAAWAQKNFSQPPQMGSNESRGRSDNPRFTLINESGQIIDNLNISPSSEESWGDDLLGTLALPPQNRVIAGPVQDSGCTFDIRVVYHDQREEILRRQNLCDLRELTFTGRNARRPTERPKSG